MLSHFHVGEREEPIEPLHGFARHPFANVRCRGHRGGEDAFNIQYLILHNNCGSPALKPRVLLFDMGASVGFKGVPNGIYPTMPEHGGGLAPSLPLFYRLYTDRCLEPDEVYAWEPNPGAEALGAQWWGNLSASVRAKVHYYQDFVNEGDLSTAESIGGAHPENSFLEILESTAKPDDFVVAKVDIDTPSAELTIVEAIAERPEIAELVDEFFFEYHFYFDNQNFGWGHKNINGDVDTAVGLMYRLRSLGIRAHFWI